MKESAHHQASTSVWSQQSDEEEARRLWGAGLPPGPGQPLPPPRIGDYLRTVVSLLHEVYCYSLCLASGVLDSNF